LVSKLTVHYKQYYTAKWEAAHEDVLVFFCPVWDSSLENVYSWVTGWKPSMVFKLIDTMRKTEVPGSSLVNLSEEQLKKIEELRLKIRLDEERVEREMERLQVAMADRKIVELARLSSRPVINGEPVSQVDELVEVALKGLMSGLEKVMKAADCVRLKTLKGTIAVVDLLAATSMLQIQMRKWGKRRDDQNDDIDS
ncbi:DOG1 domain-containing protein, partial [Cephalotus follicularis]